MYPYPADTPDPEPEPEVVVEPDAEAIAAEIQAWLGRTTAQQLAEEVRRERRMDEASS